MTSELPAASLIRRLAALGYDALLLIALIFITTGIIVPLYTHSGLPVTDINGVVKPPVWFAQGVLLPLLLLEIWGFYAWFWLHGGQTLGMNTWRIQVRRADGAPLTLKDTVKRFAAGLLSWLLLGAGYLLALVPPQRQTLHDRLSRTVVVTLPKKEKKKKG
jgi:uncharacterized RDD family membrane protein YckC